VGGVGGGVGVGGLGAGAPPPNPQAPIPNPQSPIPIVIRKKLNKYLKNNYQLLYIIK